MGWSTKEDVQVLDWLCNSPDLSPFENLWTIVKNIPGGKPNNSEDLKAATNKSVWDIITLIPTCAKLNEYLLTITGTCYQ